MNLRGLSGRRDFTPATARFARWTCRHAAERRPTRDPATSRRVAVKNFPCTSERAAFRLCPEAVGTVLAVGALLIFGSTSYGQPTYELLSTFDAANHGSAKPYDELIQASDGNFYGTTLNGGTSDLGTIFKMDGARRITTIHSFTGSDGASPRAGLVQG